MDASSETTRFDFTLSYPDRRSDACVFFEAHGLDRTLPETFDGVLFTLVAHAMREGLGLRLHGPASKTALLNLREYQLAWSRWSPARYRMVEIEAETVVDSVSGKPRSTLAAFSGGVDATFSLFSSAPSAIDLHRPLSACLLVHGFDIGLDEEAAFAAVLDDARRLHDRLGVRTHWVRTNCKALNLQDWEDSFAAQLAGCLHLYSGRFSEALIGSSESYESLVLPWGSNPITDPLLSGGEMQIVHDGAGFSRTEKLATLARHPGAIDNLRVCWAGARHDRNCGVCEKCIRTKLNLLAVGVKNPKCFAEPLELEDIDRMPIANAVQLAEIRSILDYAERNGVRGAWVPRLAERVAAGIRQTPRGRIKGALRMVGLLDTAIALKRSVDRR